MESWTIDLNYVKYSSLFVFIKFGVYMKKKSGFTLIEIIIATVIIAILAAVALPMYKRAMLKSRVNSVMPIAKTIARAQEIYYLSENKYTDVMDNLDVTHTNSEEENSAEITLRNDDRYQYVMGYHKSAPNVHYIAFLKHSENFPDAILCEAKNEDEDAQWLCGDEFEGQRIDHGSLSGSGYTSYILGGGSGDGSFSQTYQDGTNLMLTNGDVCQAQSVGGCSNSSFTEATCVGNQANGCQHNTFDHSTCLGNRGGGNADATVCGWNTYSNSDCHGEDGNNGFICGRSDYNTSSACYSNSHGGCGHSTFLDGSACYGYGNTACEQSTFNSASCIVESGGGCTGSTFTNDSTCRARGNGTSSARPCGSSSTYDHSSCYNESGNYFGCGKSTYTNQSSCHSNENGGCGGNSTFTGSSVCYGNASGACGSNTYETNSICYAMVPGACNSNTYKTGSYCDGPHCPAGSPGPGGTTH